MFQPIQISHEISSLQIYHADAITQWQLNSPPLNWLCFDILIFDIFDIFALIFLKIGFSDRAASLLSKSFSVSSETFIPDRPGASQGTISDRNLSKLFHCRNQKIINMVFILVMSSFPLMFLLIMDRSLKISQELRMLSPVTLIKCLLGCSLNIFSKCLCLSLFHCLFVNQVMSPISLC